MPEQIQEHGVVQDIHDGVATVSVLRGGSCRECGARTLCKASDDDNHRVPALDPLGVKPGDRVRITAPGKNVLLASVCLYGIPLLLLLLGIFLGAGIFTDNPEIYGSLIGIVLCALYYIILRSAAGSKRQQQRLMPYIDKIL